MRQKSKPPNEKSRNNRVISLHQTMKMKLIAFRCPEELQLRMDEYCKKYALDRTAVLRIALRLFIDKLDEQRAILCRSMPFPRKRKASSRLNLMIPNVRTVGTRASKRRNYSARVLAVRSVNTLFPYRMLRMPEDGHDGPGKVKEPPAEEGRESVCVKQRP